MMQTFVRPSRDLRNHYAEIADMTKNHNHVIITNQGRGESVLINIEDYAKYEEFLHQRYVAEELAKAKQQAADPNTQWQDHDSVCVFADIWKQIVAAGYDTQQRSGILHGADNQCGIYDRGKFCDWEKD